jgi:hypothetical protein
VQSFPSPGPSSDSPQASPGAPVANGNGGAVSPRVRNGIAVTITGVWASTYIASIFIHSFTPSPYLHALMIGLATSIWGSGFVKAAKG